MKTGDMIIVTKQSKRLNREMDLTGRIGTVSSMTDYAVEFVSDGVVYAVDIDCVKPYKV